MIIPKINDKSDAIKSLQISLNLFNASLDPDGIFGTKTIKAMEEMITPKVEEPSNNINVFLYVIRKCEGTASDNGYRMLFGGKLVTDLSHHPNIKVPFRNTFSTAAGAYQILFSVWETLRKRLNLPDFSPESQDKAAIELIRETGGLEYIKDGKIDLAVSKVRKIWASLPGAGYNQPEKSITQVRAWYVAAGGILNQ